MAGITKVQRSPNKRLIPQRKKFASRGLIKPTMPKHGSKHK